MRAPVERHEVVLRDEAEEVHVLCNTELGRDPPDVLGAPLVGPDEHELAAGCPGSRSTPGAP